ncbi:MAG: hypothetical protein E7611_06465 [Ruminococcaceae bacterium]|nr:hypothetical protein [Oscillospiraceae bacterium]
MTESNGKQSERRNARVKKDKRDGMGASGDVPMKKSSKSVTVITVAVVLAVIIINIAVSALGDAFLWFIDLTQVRYTSGEATMYTLSETCKNLIGTDAVPMIEKVNAERRARGEEPIKLNIIFCADKDHIENDPMMTYLNMTARTLEREFPHAIDVQYVNIVKDPSAVQKFKTTSASTIYNSDVIVEFGSEYLIQRISSFYYQDETATAPWAYNGEQRLSAMILSLTRAESPICAVTTNHGETLFDKDGKVKAEYSEFIELIGGAGYDVLFLDLEKDEIPESCRMMITFDPQTDFKAFGSLGDSGVSEIEKLDRYLDGSNAFFYICNRETPNLKNLEEYLEEWGVAVERASNGANTEENYIVRDSVNCTDTGRGDVVVGMYGEVGVAGGITKELSSQTYPPKVLFSNATSIKPSDSYIKTYVPADEATGAEAASYFHYYRNGVSRVLVDVFTSYDTASAYIGDEVYEIATKIDPFRLMTITRESRTIQETNYTTIDRSSYVLALSSTDFLTNDMLSSTAYGNCDVILSALRQSGTEAVPANVKLKAFYVYEMKEIADEGQFLKECKSWMTWLAVIPVAVCVFVGTAVVLKRRFK